LRKIKIKMTRTEVNKGINTKMENRLDHNTLNSNVQIGDNNNEETENMNIDDNEQIESTVINGGIHIHEGGFHLNPKQGQAAGSAQQYPSTKNALTTDHALNMLFGLIGLAVFAIGIGIAVSCVKGRNKKRSRGIQRRIENHRQKILMKEIKNLRTQIQTGHKFQQPPFNPSFENAKNDYELPVNFCSFSHISEV